ncbi:MAG: hypothetical protein LBQ60_16165 [Bacteroidales bacterium]|jgi:hypothetical protein|nr:hypothetical protein [Bacteroidales bacterium]
MKKVIIVLNLSLISFSIVYSQPEVELYCRFNLEKIFKTIDHKLKYETVRHFYMESRKSNSFIYMLSDNTWNHYYQIIRGHSVLEAHNTDSGNISPVKRISQEEMNRRIELLDCTPEKAFNEYVDFIKNIKLEKEKYLNCIGAEVTKRDSSKYAKELIGLYDFLPPGQSNIHPSGLVKKLDFLKIFKVFIFDNNEDILPDGDTVCDYLEILRFDRPLK